jgi:5'-phosphate synthase pdxT subunit
MVSNLTIGVIGVQGAVSEHVSIMKQVLKDKPDLNGKVITIRDKKDLDVVDGVILPGGESTTISRIINQLGILNDLKEKVKNKEIALMGTCAGCILLGKKMINHDSEVHLLNRMDIEVKRNAFGRQKESFEQLIQIDDFDDLYPAIFIRAPIIIKTWDSVKILSTVDEHIVMASQDNMLAISFHPELTDDLRIHNLFLSMVLKLKEK